VFLQALQDLLHRASPVEVSPTAQRNYTAASARKGKNRRAHPSRDGPFACW